MNKIGVEIEGWASFSMYKQETVDIQDFIDWMDGDKVDSFGEFEDLFYDFLIDQIPTQNEDMNLKDMDISRHWSREKAWDIYSKMIETTYE